MPEVLARSSWGGRVLKVLVPLSVYETALEIEHLVEEGEIQMEGEARTRWLSQVQPHVQKALGSFSYDPVKDIICLRPEPSVSSLKTGRQLCRPSVRATAYLNRRGRRAAGSSSRRGR